MEILVEKYIEYFREIAKRIREIENIDEYAYKSVKYNFTKEDLQMYNTLHLF